MKYPSQILVWDGKKYLLTWIRDDNLEKYTPVVQVYGIVFNDNNEILIGQSKPGSSWTIPGGSTEPRETIEETLRRELVEEVDVTVSKIFPLGAQKVEPQDAENKSDAYYQIRCVALLDKLLPQTPDPDPKHGRTWERKFVPMEKVTKYVHWGKTGAVIFREAVDLYKKIRP